MRINLKMLAATGAALMFPLAAAGLGQDTAGESPVKKPGIINGRWSNIVAAQPSVPDAPSRLEIHSNADRTFIRMWVKCKPVDCDWGEESIAAADAEKGEFTLNWRKESLAITQKLNLLDNGLLRIEGQMRWASYLGRPTESYAALLARSPDPKPSAGMLSAPPAVQRAAESAAALIAEDAAGKQTTIGSGFFLEPDLLATSYNVIKGRTRLSARLASSNTIYPVTETVHYDEERDLALLRVPGAKAWPLTLWRNMVIGGVDVFVVSNSKGTEAAASRGIVSTTRQSGADNQVEITAPALAADVGSAVVNKRGEVIGVLTSVDEGTKVTLATRASELFPLLQNLPMASASGVTRPVSLGGPKPQYTEEARANKISGTVVMRVLVGSDGVVKKVEVVRGLPDGLNQEAEKSMYQTRFKPATKNGQPIEFWITTEATFRIR